jgi:hypothetical protein
MQPALRVAILVALVVLVVVAVGLLVLYILFDVGGGATSP